MASSFVCVCVCDGCLNGRHDWFDDAVRPAALVERDRVSRISVYPASCFIDVVFRILIIKRRFPGRMRIQTVRAGGLSEGCGRKKGSVCLRPPLSVRPLCLSAPSVCPPPICAALLRSGCCCCYFVVTASCGWMVSWGCGAVVESVDTLPHRQLM